MLSKVKSPYNLESIFKYVNESFKLKLISHSKELQKKLNLSIKDYKNYSEIDIELKLIDNIENGTDFVNPEFKYRNSLHIYFNDELKDQKRIFVKQNEKVSKIKIVIDYKVKTLEGLFKGRDCITGGMYCHAPINPTMEQLNPNIELDPLDAFINAPYTGNGFSPEAEQDYRQRQLNNMQKKINSQDSLNRDDIRNMKSIDTQKKK